MTSKLKIQTVRCVPVTSIVPESWRNWFYAAMCNSEITWGSNDLTLISVDFFLKQAGQYCTEGTTTGAWREWFKKVERLPNDVYIDMEN
jgi:hypothetical protein